MILVIFILTAYCAVVADSECSGGCSGHGKCTAFDMCICYRNWQGNDCSERVCLFGVAHVDTPKVNNDDMYIFMIIVVPNAYLYAFHSIPFHIYRITSMPIFQQQKTTLCDDDDDDDVTTTMLMMMMINTGRFRWRFVDKRSLGNNNRQQLCLSLRHHRTIPKYGKY